MGAAIVIGAAAILVAGAGAAPVVPNPCTLVPGSKIASSVGLSGMTLTGVKTTRPDGAVKQSLCTFKHGKAVLEIYISPHQVPGGSGGPPGMVFSKPSGLGAGATFVYDLNPKYEFANAYFTKGSFDAGVWDNGSFPKGDVLALAHTVYAALP